MSIANEIKRLKKELGDLNKRLTKIQADISTERKLGHPIGVLRSLEENLIVQIDIKKDEIDKLGSSSTVVVTLDSNQIAISTSSVREKEEALIPK